MPTATLRKLGGSTVISLPPSILTSINARVGDSLHITLSDGEIHLKPVKKRIKYELKDLLAKYEKAMDGVERSPEDSEWLNDEPVGRELI